MWDTALLVSVGASGNWWTGGSEQTLCDRGGMGGPISPPDVGFACSNSSATCWLQQWKLGDFAATASSEESFYNRRGLSNNNAVVWEGGLARCGHCSEHLDSAVEGSWADGDRRGHAFAHGVTACVVSLLLLRLAWRGRRRVGHARWLCGGHRLAALLLCGWARAVNAAEEDACERSMLFNTRGLAVSTAAAAATGAAYFLAATALDKLAFIAQLIEEKRIDYGALVELICDRRQASVLVRWFRARGFGLVVATGERCFEKRTTRNSVAVFYRLRKYKPVKGPEAGKYRACATDQSKGAATRLGPRTLQMALRRRDMSVVNVVAWHGCHEEPRFAQQMHEIEGLSASGCDAVVLGDVNRRADIRQASRANALGTGDMRWRDFVGWGTGDMGESPTRAGYVRMVPLLDEGEAAATRRATVNGERQWAVLDRLVEVGAERLRWQLDEIVWADQAGVELRMLSDHAAVCYVKVSRAAVDAGESRPALPDMRRWTRAQHQRFVTLTRGLEERARQEGGSDAAERMRLIDAELASAAEIVELERDDFHSSGLRSDHDNYSLKQKWAWRLKTLLRFRETPDGVRAQRWLTHPRCELRHDLRHYGSREGDATVLWRALVGRCRKEVRFYTRVCDADKAHAARLAERVARAEAEEDSLRRVKLAHDLLRGRWEAQEKVAVVAINDDPAQGFVHDPPSVRREAANVGRLSQEDYLGGEPVPAHAFEAWLEHFTSKFDALKAPHGGGDFNLDELLTFELFEETLMSYARYKSVGARARGAVSSLELVRRLDEAERRAYFTAAKSCLLEGKRPKHWEQMVYVLLPKKHGDQRKIRKKREIALMDQTLKLMLKCVKKVSFERMIGRTGEDNHGWVPGHGALNSALMMDAVLGQARELRHSIYMLFLDLKQFFPSIKRKARAAAEYFVGLPEEVVLLAKAVFRNMRARFDTAHGLSDEFDILGGDLMGCVLSPSHARCLLTSVSVAIAAVSCGVRVWGCDKRARHVAQTMMADDWAGFNTTEASLQAQWSVWVDYAMATGSPIGVAGLEKTVVTAARFSGGKWVDVPVQLRIPRGAGGFQDMPEFVPQLNCREAYPHMGIPRSICGGRKHLLAKLQKGVAALVQRLKRIKFDKGQHITCANCLKGSYVGYYAAAYGLTMAEAERLEKVWRASFRSLFGVHVSTPTAHFYGGKADRVADSLHGRHVLVDAVSSLYNTCRRALASPEDSSERALARSALARRLRKWGCSRAPTEWLGSEEHVNTAKVIEEELESGRVQGEAFDFFIMYTAWMVKQDVAIFNERVARGELPPSLRNVLAIEHDDGEWGEALMHADHAAWHNGSSKSLHEVLGHAAPGTLLLAGISLVEHVCKPGAEGYAFEVLTFAELARRWELPRSRRAFQEYERLVRELQACSEDSLSWFPGGQMTRTMFKPCTSWQLWDGLGGLVQGGRGSGSWPVGDGIQSRRAGSRFTDLLRESRASGETMEKARWAEALRESYPGVRRAAAVEWWDGAPRDEDRYGARLVQIWPGACHRDGGCVRVSGRRGPSAAVEAGRDARAQAVTGWGVGDGGELTKDGRAASFDDAAGLPGVRLLMQATSILQAEGAEVDTRADATIREAGKWAIHVQTSRRLLEEWNELHVQHDIQFAAATDGGRQVRERGQAVASAAALRDDGLVVGGALDANAWARSSYECELQALIDVVKSWPSGARVLLAVDARSPVQAAVKFRAAHVNKRAEYFCDDMLDELLRELERMDTAIFYWLKGHSGAAPNEAADLQATRFLEEEPLDVGRRPARRHASLTFAFDRRPFAWAAERVARHVHEVLRRRSHRSIWRPAGCWDLRWGKGEAARKRVLHSAQTKRLVVGDESYFEGERAARAQEVRCKCGRGRCTVSHWLFECGLPNATDQRATLREQVADFALCARVLNGGRPDAAAESALNVLVSGEASREVQQSTLGWLVGCMPTPRVTSMALRARAMAVVRQCADALRAAEVEYRQDKSDFLVEERRRSLAVKVVARLRVWATLKGPGAARAARDGHRGALAALGSSAATAVEALGPRRTWRQEDSVLRGDRPRRLQCSDDWVRCCDEWRAALIILRAWRRRYACLTEGSWAIALRSADGAITVRALSVVRPMKWWAIAAGRCPARGAQERKAARDRALLNRERKKRAQEQQAGLFQAMMGLEGDGHITLADGLEDVDVRFTKRRRVNWKAPGSRRKRKAPSGARQQGRAGRSGKRQNRAGGGRERRGWCGYSESDDERGDDSQDDRGSDFTDDLSDGASDDGDGGAGAAWGVHVGDLLRIYWTDERVWFRCRVTGVGREGGKVRVEYLLPGWEPFVHDLGKVRWERWADGDEVDPGEASYHPEVWLGPVDAEAAAAANGASSRGDDQARRGVEPAGEAECDRENAREGVSASSDSRTSGAAGGTGGESEEFGWLRAAAGSGKGAKKRKVLVQTLVQAFREDCRDNSDVPMVALRTVYRFMSGVMTARAVKEELRKLTEAGWLVMVNDAVSCGWRRGHATDGTGTTAATEAATASEGPRSGRRAGAGRPRGGGGSGGTAAPADEGLEAGLAEDGSCAGAQRSRRGGAQPTYVESEQESAEDSDGDWS